MLAVRLSRKSDMKTKWDRQNRQKNLDINLIQTTNKTNWIYAGGNEILSNKSNTKKDQKKSKEIRKTRKEKRKTGRNQEKDRFLTFLNIFRFIHEEREKKVFLIWR